LSQSFTQTRSWISLHFWGRISTRGSSTFDYYIVSNISIPAASTSASATHTPETAPFQRTMAENPEETSPIRYIVYCGKPPPHGRLKDMEEMHWRERAPASLCKPRASNGDDSGLQEAISVFLKSIVQRHHEEILKDHAWQCANCDKPATQLVHSPHAILCNNPGGIYIHDIGPAVMDITAPICTSSGACHREAEKTTHEYAQLILSLPAEFGLPRSCVMCGNKPGYNFCMYCREVIV